MPENTDANVDGATTHHDVATVVTKEDDVMKHPELYTEVTTRDDQADNDVEGLDQSSQDNETMTEESAHTDETKNQQEKTSAVAKYSDNTTGVLEINFMKEVENNRWYEIGSGIRRYMFITLFLPMVSCNIILFIVMNLKHNRGNSTCVFMAALAGSDSAILLNGFRIWLQYELSLYPIPNPLCKFSVYVTHLTWTLSSFFIVAMSYDRCYAILLPLLAKAKCTTKRARVTCGVLFLILVIFYAPLILFSGLDSADQCVRYNLDTWYATAYSYISLVVYPLIPFVLVISFNCAIYFALWRRKHSSLAYSSTIDKVENQLTIMIVVVCVAFLILMLPFEIREKYMYYTGYNTTPHDVAVHTFTFQLTMQLTFINSGINFFLYCSSRKFRMDLKILFKMCCTRTGLELTD